MKNRNALRGIALILLLVTSAYASCSGCANQKGNETVVIDLSPKAKILFPGDTEFYEGDQINFAGIFTGQDTCGKTCSYLWYSSRDGFIGSGISIYRNNLSVGRHVIEFRYIDGAGGVWKATKNLTIKPATLNIGIALPRPEELYRVEDNIPFKAEVNGGVPPYTYSWLLDDRVVNNGEYFEMKVSEGTHNVRLEVKDSGNSYMAAERTLWVGKLADAVIMPLKASIKKPRNGQTTREGYTVQFEASVSGGIGSYVYNWTSDVNGHIGNEKMFYYSNLTAGPNGSNTITLRVSDSAGFAVSSNVTMKVEVICNKDGGCHNNENYINCPDDCPTGSEDGICDKATDGRCDPDCKRKDDPDCICNKNGFCDIGTENYANCPDDCISGSQDGICDGIDDGRCDPDCKTDRDSDCSSGNGTEYFLLLILIACLVFVYLRFMRGR